MQVEDWSDEEIRDAGVQKSGSRSPMSLGQLRSTLKRASKDAQNHQVRIVDKDFTGEVSLDKQELSCHVVFVRCNFRKGLTITNSKLGALYISGGRFDEDAVLRGCTLGEFHLDNPKLGKEASAYIEGCEVTTWSNVGLYEARDGDVTINQTHFFDNLSVRLRNSALTLNNCRIDVDLDAVVSSPDVPENRLTVTKTTIGHHTAVLLGQNGALTVESAILGPLTVDRPSKDNADDEDERYGDFPEIRRSIESEQECSGAQLSVSGSQLTSDALFRLGQKGRLLLRTSTVTATTELDDSTFDQFNIRDCNLHVLRLHGCSFDPKGSIRSFMDNSASTIEFIPPSAPYDASTFELDLKQARQFLADLGPTSGNFSILFEDSLRSQGRTEDANDFYIDRRRRETRADGQPWTSKALSYIMDGAIGFGKRPFAPLVLLTFLWLVGVFACRKVELRKEGEPAPSYSGLIFALDALLPVVDLEMSKFYWPTSKLGGFYCRIAAIAGWLLIPLSLAGFANLVK